MHLFTFEFRQLVRAASAASVTVAVILAMTGSADANTRECRSIKSQLASLSSGGNGANRARYDSAYNRQIAEMRKTEQMIRDNNCTHSSRKECRALKATVAKMRKNAFNLKRTRDGSGRSVDTGRKRQLERQWRALSCDTARTTVRQKSVSSRSSSGSSKPSSSGSSQRSVAPAPLSSLSGGGYRVMCVRLHDGYFFPVAFDTNAPDYDRGAEACKAMCPGAETRVFSHRLPDEETEAMVDKNGNLYTELETAFAYLDQDGNDRRSCRVPQTANNAANGTVLPEGELNEISETDADSRLPRPSWRPDLLVDPETALNAATGLTVESIRRLTDAVTIGEGVDLVARSNIRVVLPQFLPDPTEAEDQPVQGPTSVQ